MADYFLRIWNDLGARVSGPLSLRLFLQPIRATIFAIRNGLKDAKTGRPPYFYLLNGPFTRIARTFAHKSFQKPSLALVAVLCFASIAIAQEPLPSDSPEEERAPVQASTDKWQFAVTPYAFLPRLNGTVGVLNQTAQVNASFSDIFSNLNFAAMGTFEARKKNWTVLVDGMYMSLSGQKVTPSPFFSDIDVKVKEIVITPEVGYRVLQLEKGSIDILGGVRIWHVKSHLTFQPRILPLVDVEGTKNWADPIVGARGTVTVSPRTFLRGEFDAGGFGIGSNFTGQVFGGAGFQFKPRVALIGGYRYVRTDYVNDNFVFRTALSGVIIGAQFKL